MPTYLPRRFVFSLLFLATATVFQTASTLAVAADKKAAYSIIPDKAKSDDGYVLVTPKSRFEGEARIKEKQRRTAILNKANQMFTLFGAEVALEKDKLPTALATYRAALRDNPSPQVAGRLMQIALNNRMDEQAAQAYDVWRQLEPQPSAFQQRMAFLWALRQGNDNEAADGFKTVFNQIDNEVLQKQLFLDIAKQSIDRKIGGKRFSRALTRQAKSLPDMAEAAVADAVVSAQAGNVKNAVDALNRLAKIDPELGAASELTLRLVAQDTPDVLVAFFHSKDVESLSPSWQEIRILALKSEGKIDEAYQVAKAQLAQKPSYSLYMLASSLGVTEGLATKHEVITWLQSAFKMAETSEERSNAATMLAMHFIESGDEAEARKWIRQINAPSRHFDKMVLQASLAIEHQHWAEALKYLRTIRKENQDGHFFDRQYVDNLWLSAVVQGLEPKKAERELSNTLNEAKKVGDEELGNAALYLRGIVYAEKLNQPALAVADFKKYVEINPSNPIGLNALGYTMLSLPNPDLDESFRLINLSYQLRPESPEVNDSLGWVYYLKGEGETALPYLQYAYEESSEPEVAAHYIEVLHSLGKIEQAAQVLRQALAKSPQDQQLKQIQKRFNILTPNKNK